MTKNSSCVFVPDGLKNEMRRKLVQLRAKQTEIDGLLNEIDSLVEEGYDEKEVLDEQRKQQETLFGSRNQRLRYRNVH